MAPPAGSTRRRSPGLLLALGAGALAVGAAAAPQSTAEPSCRPEAKGEVSLLQSGLHVKRQGHLGAAAATCTPLQNMGTWLAAEMSIGTPWQNLTVMVDTGRENVVLLWCECTTASCPVEATCFDAPLSSTGQLFQGQVTTMSFFDGVDFKIGFSTDVVKVGGTSATLEKGLLLIKDSSVDMNVAGSLDFEGILGLGLPKASPEYPQFLPTAGVTRFSVCLGDAGGELETAAAAVPDAIPNIGSEQWGLGLWGVSVGSAAEEGSSPVACGSGSMASGQLTPCGAIVDSGAALVSGPQDQVLEMLGGLCAAWASCAATMSPSSSAMEKADAFVTLLYGCSSWMSEAGLGELPSVFLSLGDTTGGKKVVELPASAYVATAEKSHADADVAGSHLKAVRAALGITNTLGEGQYEDGTVCVPSFGVLDYPTALTGATWVLGMPLFYQYKVTFDQTPPMSIAFSSDACTQCSGEAPELSPARQLGRQLRKAAGLPRVRKYNTALPL